MAATARSRVLRVAQSGELRATFRQIAEIEGPDGPKYTRACLSEVAATVAGRTYGSMLLELCHLVRAATLASASALRTHGFEWLFWGVTTARRSAYQAAFDAAGLGTSAPVEASQDGVMLAYPNTTFEVRYGRMPVLGAMMEFLVSVLGYRGVVQSVESLGTVSATSRTVADAANDLSRRLYAVLGDHLPPAQEQRRFHAMTAYLEGVAGPDFTEDDIDDAAVLAFWLAKAVSGGEADFRGYRTTWRGFLRLIRVLAGSPSLADVDEPMEMDAGMAERITEPIGPGHEDANPLDDLGEDPAASVKALTKRQIILLETPIGDPDGVRRLPLSYLRAACFAPLQGRLSQALRRKAGPDELGALVAEANRVEYAEHLALLDDTASQVRLVAQACLHVLRQTDEAADHGSDTEMTVLAEAREAFDAINRAGFDRAALVDPERRPAFVALADILPEIADRLRTTRSALEMSPWRTAEAADRRTFRDAFDQLYGAPT